MAERGGLENRYTSNGIGGSNPPVSAANEVSEEDGALRLCAAREDLKRAAMFCEQRASKTASGGLRIPRRKPREFVGKSSRLRLRHDVALAKSGLIKATSGYGVTKSAVDMRKRDFATL